MGGSKGSLMELLGAFNQAEARTKFAVKRSGVIAHYLEPAALHRAFWPKRAYDDVAGRLNAVGNLPYVSSPLLGRSEKMEHCPIMPDVVHTLFKLDFGDIADEPTYLLCDRTQSPSGDVDRGLRDIEDRGVLISAKKKIVNQG